MENKEYEKITLESNLDQDDIAQRKVNGVYEYYIVTAYDEIHQNYDLKSFNGNIEAFNIQLVASTQELINNFEKEIDDSNIK